MARWIVRLLLAALVLEASSFAALVLLTGGLPFAKLRADRDARMQPQTAGEAGAPPAATATTMAVPHPFLGFTNDPAFDPEKVKAAHTVPVSEWGFLDDKPPIQAASADRAIVGLFGGSVAFWNSVHGIDALRTALSQAKSLAGRELVFVRTAMGGYKQPQQLMTLAWLVALGGHFDIVINLDGFNEVAIPATNIVPAGLFPFFPRDWHAMLGSTGGADRARLIGRITYLQDRLAVNAARFSAGPLAWSPTANLVWMILDRRSSAELDRAQLELAATKPAGIPYAGRGPARSYASPDAMYDDLAEVWKNSSVEMDRLCDGLGIRYFHFLQPNQHVPGTKPIGPEEAAVAVRKGAPYAPGAAAGYPKMISKGRDLVAGGVDFTDLTQIFATVSEPRYVDSCCHVNPTGYAEISRAIGEHVRAALDGAPASASR